MLNPYQNTATLVSVIIPSFNHGRYLLKALKSILMQGYPAIEIIVVDDGSTDNTQEIIKEIPGIKYIYQVNQGLSAARNTGIKNSNGEFLVFLDADDWLLPEAIQTNIDYLLQDESLAFVSGAHEKFYVEHGTSHDGFQEINANHYWHMLQGNYIEMHATVMYRRWIFNEFLYEVTLKACEDYDLYLNITRKYPVLHHSQKIAAYRMHGFNMSGNLPMMLSTALEALDKQKKNLHTDSEKMAYKKGRKFYKEYYSSLLYHRLLAKKSEINWEAFFSLVKYQPELAFKYILKKESMFKSFIKKNIPAYSRKWLSKIGFYSSYSPAVGAVSAGDFDRHTPFSTQFGFDRGGPVDRYYIENFLKKEAGNIKGRVLEIGDNEYSLMFGGQKLVQSDILHIDESNAKATFIGDLSNAPHLPTNAFDCIVLTQTLHLVYDFKGALATCHRILKPGGVLLLTSPGITPVDHGEWKSTWYWSFTDSALKRVVTEAFPAGEVEIATFGNVYVATAFLYGMGVTEVSQERLDHHDPHFQVIITVKAVKGMAA
ncbi:MAG: glycosyltransferase [Ferruginibacter sp.]|nr:glycosyltransferase [Ferruginibacter sp.]